ncbi:ATP-binding cassette domain-containing protein [Subtercola endophyticus]|uniref:ATP-binding cassette domain-containing protein n=1 Tax=Subtercola endophyticus TaxID=2895559 RepID=UPI001E4AAD9B|nr:ATP-binding cassette domain-containing protein [Subtercola endophyticus]UFS58270.1 ATP-binding cassette domain-containing protein [Subtercola endophyticus]
MPVPPLSLRLSSISARSSAGTGIRSVSFEVARGGVHGVLGENLSGASELLAVIGGYLPLTAGRLEIDGVAVSFAGHAAAEAAGVAVVRGEPSIVPHLSVAENVFLGREKSFGGIVRFGRMYAESGALLARLGLPAVPVRKPAGDLDAGERRVIELARALVAGRRIVLIDEPFSGLDARGLALVARGIAGLAAAGVTVVVATYRADMLLRVAGSITVLSRGSAVETLRVAGGGGGLEDSGAEAAAVEARLVGYMTTNIHVVRRIRHESIEPGPVVLDVRGWSAFHPLDPALAVVRDVSLTVRASEIVGLAGLDGSGISELALSLFGRSYGPAVSGEILLGGHPFAARSPAESIAAGLSLATDSNTTYDLGLLGGLPSSISPSTLARLARLGLIDRKRDYRTAAPAFRLGGISDIVRGARMPGSGDAAGGLGGAGGGRGAVGGARSGAGGAGGGRGDVGGAGDARGVGGVGGARGVGDAVGGVGGAGGGRGGVGGARGVGDADGARGAGGSGGARGVGDADGARGGAGGARGGARVTGGADGADGAGPGLDDLDAEPSATDSSADAIAEFGGARRSGRGGSGAAGAGGVSGVSGGPGSRSREALEIWLDQPPERRPKVVVLDHPTRGVAPDAALQLRDLIVQLAASGTAVLLVSADIEELLVMTTRVYTMVDGRITAEISTLDASPQNLLATMIRPLA